MSRLRLTTRLVPQTSAKVDIDFFERIRAAGTPAARHTACLASAAAPWPPRAQEARMATAWAAAWAARVGRAAAAAAATTAATVAAAHLAGSNRLTPKGALQRRAGGRWKRDAMGASERRHTLAKADSRNFGKSGKSNFRLDARGLGVLHAAGTQRPWLPATTASTASCASERVNPGGAAAQPVTCHSK